MKASELRIGNLAMAIHTNGAPDKFVQVIVQPDHICTCNAHPEWWNPISLTEEWLLKFGFKWECGGAFMAHPSKLSLSPCHDLDFNESLLLSQIGATKHFQIVEWRYSASSINGRNTRLKFVHQLQNLYFALSGEELTINKSSETPV